ncbi:hypothetical protein GCM10020367_71630 [Streptomyces sannanensis]|uniref:Uncharacterized protein n=1 Tax=Streptomyces sannanensis TaxID=285536 RepID=A0ABP6SP04_9ACTN
MTTDLEHVEVVDAELVDDGVPAEGAVGAYNPAAAAVLKALESDTGHLNRIRPK